MVREVVVKRAPPARSSAAEPVQNRAISASGTARIAGRTPNRLSQIIRLVGVCAMATQHQNRIVDFRAALCPDHAVRASSLAVHGEIDLANAGLLDAELNGAEQTDAEEIVLDLSGVEFIDYRVAGARGRRAAVGARLQSPGRTARNRRGCTADGAHSNR